MSHRAQCACEFCAQDRLARAARMHVVRDEHAASDAVTVWACTLLLLLAVLGVFASWWVSQ